jgi:flavodoxin I
MHSLHVIYASTSGNTEYVVDTLLGHLRERAPGLRVSAQRAELASAEDLKRGDALVLCSGTWNTGGREGQLQMYMHKLLMEKAAGIDLAGKPMTFISLGDSRYYFTTRCTEHFLRFQRTSKGKLFLPPFVLVNEPYGQEAKIAKWSEALLRYLSAPVLSVPVP